MRYCSKLRAHSCLAIFSFGTCSDVKNMGKGRTTKCSVKYVTDSVPKSKKNTAKYKVLSPWFGYFALRKKNRISVDFLRVFTEF